MIESGLGLCAACLPVQWGLLHSEPVRNVLRSKNPLGSSIGQSGTRSQRHFPASKSEALSDASPYSRFSNDYLPGTAISTRCDPDLELRDFSEGNGIVVTRSFRTAGHAV